MCVKRLFSQNKAEIIQKKTKIWHLSKIFDLLSYVFRGKMIYFEQRAMNMVAPSIFFLKFKFDNPILRDCRFYWKVTMECEPFITNYTGIYSLRN